MKLIVRTNFWGPKVHGTKFKPKVAPYKPYRLMLAQIDFQEQQRHKKNSLDRYQGNGSNLYKPPLGCCPHQGGYRVMELTERHFLDAHNGFWDIYLTRTFLDNAGCRIHEFLLLPANQTKIDVNNGIRKEGWKFWAKIQACILRIELEPLFSKFLQQERRFGYHVSHAHLFVLMDVAIDQKHGENKSFRGRQGGACSEVLKETHIRNVNEARLAENTTTQKNSSLSRRTLDGRSEKLGTKDNAPPRANTEAGRIVGADEPW